ncbi:MAG TPA: hypothetical protein V6D18_15355 [Thermosynechococcaceae cyanobacterium]
MARQQNRRTSIDDWSGFEPGGEEGKFDLWNLNLKRPFEATAKGLLWVYVLVPIGVAFIWGVYTSDNIAGVLGISARRGTGAFIQETQPIGQSLVNGTSGKGFVQKSIKPEGESLRPGANPETNGPGVTPR